MSLDFYLASSVEYLALGSIYFLKRKSIFHKRQATVLIFIGCSLFLSSIQNYFDQGITRIINDFFHLFFIISGTIMIYTISIRFSRKTSSKHLTTFGKEFFFFSTLALFASLVIVAFWNRPEEIFAPNLFYLVSETSIFILIIYCILYRYAVKMKYLKREMRLIYFLVILMIVEKINLLAQPEQKEFFGMLSGIFYILSPIFLFTNLIYFANEGYEKVSEAITNPDHENQMNANLYVTNTVLKGIDIEAIKYKLYNLLEKEKIFFDEDIRLPSVAEEMEISTHVLSAFINHHLRTNFNTLINYYRIKEAISLFKEEPRRTTMSVGMAVGFNSNSTFQRSFIQFTKLSPSKFREQIRNGRKIEFDSSLQISVVTHEFPEADLKLT
ncbi:AraC family transcriptional regulator [Leptospira yasudae]|uniref:AraC family transcriptional regulator n=1 Tax=Leptospira yasudae TaxID=2202201 RepID=UPI001C4F5FF8|nr:helix-turn-helix domain-containing protein [Leptospira yasudae]MBW0432086.1 AraC family transcriptional regulator [Leptospira yasudae]